MIKQSVEQPIHLESGRKRSAGLAGSTGFGIRTYSPREGTETFYLLHTNQFSTIRIRTYLPREGTETFITPPPRLQYPHNVEHPIHL